MCMAHSNFRTSGAYTMYYSVSLVFPVVYSFRIPWEKKFSWTQTVNNLLRHFSPTRWMLQIQCSTKNPKTNPQTLLKITTFLPINCLHRGYIFLIIYFFIPSLHAAIKIQFKFTLNFVNHPHMYSPLKLQLKWCYKISFANKHQINLIREKQVNRNHEWGRN